MSNCSECGDTQTNYSRVLWVALILNFLMFGVEIVASWFAGSVAIFADAMDFLGDTGNYGASLVSLKFTPRWRSGVAMVKGITMGVYGLIIIGLACFGNFLLERPNGILMMLIAILALIVNIGVAILLYRYREGDSNRRSVWLCSRNDAIINILVLLAGLVISIIHHRWPDTLVALAIGGLGLKSSYAVIQHAYQELATDKSYNL